MLQAARADRLLRLSPNPGPMHPSIRTCGVLLFVAILVIVGSCAEGSLGGPVADPTVEFSPATAVSLEVDQSTALTTTVKNVDFVADSVLFSSSAPGIVSATKSGRGDVILKGIAEGTATITARVPAVNVTTTIQVTVAARPELRSEAILLSSGDPADINSIAGTIRLFFGMSRPSSVPYALQLGVDNEPVFPCTPASATQFVCTLNTAEGGTATLGALNFGKFANGPHTLAARMIAPNGTTTATITRPLTFANKDQIRLEPDVSLTNPQSPRSAFTRLWARTTLYSIGTGLQLKLTGSSAGGQPVSFTPSTPIGPPFTWEINPAANPNVEGLFNFNVDVLDANNNPIPSTLFNVTPAPINLDFLPPRFTITQQPPPTSSIVIDAVSLTYATGPYPALTVISLSRLTDFTIIFKHPPLCDVDHVHSDALTIKSADGTSTSGPHRDPQFTRGDECGHGPLTNLVLSQVTFGMAGRIVDADLKAALAQLYRRLGATCDAGTNVVDDLLIEFGPGPGQSPSPVIDLFPTAGNFNTTFTLNTNQTLLDTNLCVRLSAADAAIGNNGQPAPNTAVTVFPILLRKN